GLGELHLRPPDFTTRLSERPVGSPCARLLAPRHAKLTNLRHRMVDLDQTARFVLQHLDGTNDRAALIARLRELVDRGVVSLQRNDAQIGPEAVQQGLESVIDEALRALARMALLVA